MTDIIERSLSADRSTTREAALNAASAVMPIATSGRA